MNALATAPGVISPAGKYYISANEVMLPNYRQVTICCHRHSMMGFIRQWAV